MTPNRPPAARLVAALLVLLLPGAALAREVAVPAGTVVYGELDEEVTSRVKKDGTEVGDMVRAHVWRDVVVDGAVVVKAGTPVLARVSEVKKSKLAGIKGKLEVEAVSTQAVDGSDLMLDGGYDKSGRGRKALSITLAAAVAWPLIFIKGKHAILESGTVFDASTQSTASIRVEGAAPAKIRLGGADSGLEASVDEAALHPEGKDEFLPLRLRNCGGTLDGARVVTVNGGEVEPLPVDLGAVSQADDCAEASGQVRLKLLSKTFRKGINRFEVEAGGQRAEIVLDVEL